MRKNTVRGVRKFGLMIATGAAALSAPLAVATPPSGGAGTSVIVMESSGAGNGPERAVVRLGGRVDRDLPLIKGFSATLPASRVAALRSTPGVKSVTPNQRVRMQAYLPGTTMEQTTAPNSMWNLTKNVGAHAYWARGYTGKGIDIAVIDTGVDRVKGLSATGKVVYGPDLSFEQPDSTRRNRDSYGHGTHMAGIAAGRDSTYASTLNSSAYFNGVAPDARIVSIKVGDRQGVTDVTQIIAAINWATEHRNDPGMNIRVMLLALGTDGTQHYTVDPLMAAAEAAWHNGITVVVAAGNGGKDGINGAPSLTNPAIDPWIIAVGAQDHRGTVDPNDDGVAPFSSQVDWSVRTPDFIAAGTSIPSLRVPGSYIDSVAPASSKLGTRFLLGSGTSQAAAATAGAVALLLQQHPEYVPGQVRSHLMLYGVRKLTVMSDVGSPTSGMGRLDLSAGIDTTSPHVFSASQKAYGAGTLDGSRGSRRVTLDGVPLQGQMDIHGTSFDSYGMALASMQGRTWSGDTWNGRTWSGSAWTGRTWSGALWTGRTWSGSAWTGSAWTGNTWNSAGWK